jgi:site-specific DNA-methyltransferase (adenine-specific)
VQIERLERAGATLYCADALEVLRLLPDSSVDLIVTDPPYYRVKGLAWDRAWNTAEGFVAWIGQLADEWCRVLKPNGSLYCYASPRMAARVEVEIGKRFEVLNRIRWIKQAGWHHKAEKEALRSFLSPWEEIIFAEHVGADNAAKGESGYGAECDRLRGFVFEPLRAWFCVEKARLGLTNRDINLALGTACNGSGMAGHYFKKSGAVQWEIPTRACYDKLAAMGFSRRYEDLRREYEDLRREYEDLRRPFTVTEAVPYTDVWDFKTVPHRPGKHPCEKPLDLCEHIVRASSRPGAVVLDSFCGSGAFGEAAVRSGRSFIGSDNDPHWIAQTARRLEAIHQPPAQPGLFDAAQAAE